MGREVKGGGLKGGITGASAIFFNTKVFTAVGSLKTRFGYLQVL
jgi:hypothetical protein